MDRGPNMIVMKLHVDRGRASAQRLKRISADSDRGNTHLFACADEVSVRREVCRAFDCGDALFDCGDVHGGQAQ